jgi:hypothetical protein
MTTQTKRTVDEESGPPVLARELLKTLMLEYEAMKELESSIEGQLEALRTMKVDQLEEQTLISSGLAEKLKVLRRKREGQLRLLSRFLNQKDHASSLQETADALKDLDPVTSRELLSFRSRMLDLAGTTKNRCSDLEFSLQHALQMGQEIIGLLQLNETSTARVYTSNGVPAQATQAHSLVNQLG